MGLFWLGIFAFPQIYFTIFDFLPKIYKVRGELRIPLFKATLLNLIGPVIWTLISVVAISFVLYFSSYRTFVPILAYSLGGFLSWLYMKPSELDDAFWKFYRTYRTLDPLENLENKS